MKERIIFHCDCNSFYASVELLSYPHLKDLPVAVCGDPESRHGIILAKNELAKKYGIQGEEKELTAEERAAQSERESMFILNEWALRWFQRQMHETPDGRAIGLSYFREER